MLFLGCPQFLSETCQVEVWSCWLVPFCLKLLGFHFDAKLARQTVKEVGAKGMESIIPSVSDPSWNRWICCKLSQDIPPSSLIDFNHQTRVEYVFYCNLVNHEDHIKFTAPLKAVNCKVLWSISVWSVVALCRVRCCEPNSMRTSLWIVSEHSHEGLFVVETVGAICRNHTPLEEQSTA